MRRILRRQLLPRMVELVFHRLRAHVAYVGDHARCQAVTDPAQIRKFGRPEVTVSFRCRALGEIPVVTWHDVIVA